MKKDQVQEDGWLRNLWIWPSIFLEFKIFKMVSQKDLTFWIDIEFEKQLKPSLLYLNSVDEIWILTKHSCYFFTFLG